MDSTIFDETLAEALGDPDGTVYTVSARKYAASRALRAYSRYKPYKRRMGTAHLFLPSASAQNYVNVVGGPFQASDSVVIDQFGVSPETLTVSTCALEFETSRQSVQTSKVVFSAPMASAHNSGSWASKATPGLVLKPGVEVYAMPPDLIRVDQDSFDIATGKKVAGGRKAGFHDGAYPASQAFDGSGVSGKLNYGPIVPGSYPYPGASGFPVSSLSQLRFEWIYGQTTILRVVNPPAVALSLDFSYWGSHVFETLPEQDIEPVINYARYAALSAHASKLAASPDYQEGDVRRWGSRSATALRMEAHAAKDEFDIAIRKAPFAVAG